MAAGAVSPRDFVVRSDAQGLWAVVRDGLLVAGVIGLAESIAHPVSTVLAVLFIGRIQFAMGESLLHEASHHNLFRTRRFNPWVEWVAGLPFGTTWAAWRREHLQHHRRLGTADDHVVETYEAAGLRDPNPNIAWAWWGRPLTGAVTWDYATSLVAMNTARDWAKVGAFWTVVGGLAAWAGRAPELLTYWVAPWWLVFPVWLYWSEIADHYRTVGGNRTRLGRVSNWLDHHNGYHEVHHRWPSIPFHKLRAAHRALVPASQDVAGGWWSVWRQVSREAERPEGATEGFWPRAS